MPTKIANLNSAPAKRTNGKEMTATVTAITTQRKHKTTLHKGYRFIEVEMTNGTKFVTRSTYQHDLLRLDIDITTHPAWTGEANYVNTSNSEVAKFHNRFGGLSFFKKN